MRILPPLPMSAGMEFADALGGNLGREAQGHDAVVADAHPVSRAEAAGAGQIDLHFLAALPVAHEEAIAVVFQDIGCHCHGITFSIRGWSSKKIALHYSIWENGYRGASAGER
jgi:hypothetical protein